MGAIFGMLASLSISTAEIFGRRLANAGGPLAAAAIASALATVTTLVVALVIDGSPGGADLLLGAASGLGFGLGIAAYLAGVSVSSSAVVAPTTAALTTIIPFGVASIVDEAPRALGLVGVAAVLAGLVLITTGGGSASNVVRGAAIGALAGVGYGIGTAVLIGVSDDAGGWPLVPQRAVALVAIVAWARRRGVSLAIPRTHVRDAPAMGVFAGASSVFILLGLRADAATASVTGNLFPASSVLVGRMLFGDSLSRAQVVGLGIVLAGIVAIVTA